ncbi:MAG: peptidoglycan bridge formation glycyltransferase FemA/FemB family protein [Spirochaetia bacterium]|nr:peptidoglycan bridge formation glycyltransferase FemA/FemB family protein [Spirochaetia bacterium]
MILSLIQDESTTLPVKDFLQSRFWAGFKCAFGWSSLRFRVESDDTATYELSVLVRKLAGPFVFAYVPHGPEAEYRIGPSQDHLQRLATSLKAWLPRSCMFIRFDPGWYCIGGETGTPARPEFALPLKKASDVQPPDTVVLDLSCTEEELLARMKPKWRYNIRLAEKKNVSITEESSSALDVFYTLYEQTAARDRISVHPKSYYEKLFEHASRYHTGTVQATRVPAIFSEGRPSDVKEEPHPDLRLWVARHDSQALACIVTLFYGTTATYLYGASSDEKRNLMPAYALQWAAIKAARNAGCREYDMYGIPPTNDEQHPMAGLYRFKTGFGGELRHYPGAWDYVFRPLLYSAFHIVELARLFWHKKIMKTRRQAHAKPVT